MQDYFSDFLLGKNPIGALASALGDSDITASQCGSNWKLHLIWAAVTVALVYVSWKLSLWYASYQFIKNPSSNFPSTALAKS